MTERPRELLDDLDDLRDRAGDLSGELQKRSKRWQKDLRKRSKTATKRADQLRSDAFDLADDVRDRIGDPRERAEELRDRAEELRPALRRLAIHLLRAFQALLTVLLTVPRLVVRVLGAIGDLLDRAEVARERGHEMAERARDAAHAVRPSRRMRWRRRVLTTLLVGGAFAVGFATGWLLAQRAIEDSVYDEAPVGLQPVTEPLRTVGDTDTGEADEPDGDEAGSEPGTGTGA